MPGIVALAMAGLHVFCLFDPASGARQKLKRELTGEPAQIFPRWRAHLFSNYLDK